MLSRCFLDFCVGVGAFVIALSQISSFFFYICNPCLQLIVYSILDGIICASFISTLGLYLERCGTYSNEKKIYRLFQTRIQDLNQIADSQLYKLS